MENQVINSKVLLKLNSMYLPGGPVVKTLPSMQGVRVQSLVGKLRSHMPWGQKKKKNPKDKPEAKL